MKSSCLLLRYALATALGCFASSVVVAQDTTPPYVAKPISDLTVSANAAPTVINLKKTFALQNVTGSLVRFATSEGNIDVELLASAAPASVANFLSYANAGSYNNSFIHRSVPGFVIQGGGYAIANGKEITIPENAAVTGEHTFSNTRGTLSYALSTGPNSATDQWFFNLADNTELDDTSDGGPFTVFGRITGDGLKVVDAIAGLQIVNLGSPLDELPVLPSYNQSTVQLADLVYVNSITALPLTPKATGDAAVFILKAKNSNPDLVTATFTGQKMTLTYAASKTGSANIVVVAKDPAGTKAKATFTVTVQ